MNLYATRAIVRPCRTREAPLKPTSGIMGLSKHGQKVSNKYLAWEVLITIATSIRLEPELGTLTNLDRNPFREPFQGTP